ncbi:MAG: hypothetical protein WB930_06315 [Syntrophobacteraceae bacterium]
MKKSTSTCLALFSVLLLGCYVHAFSNPLWDDFLRNPTEEALATLENTVEASQKPCDPSCVPSEQQQALLFKLIRGGNSSAFRAGLSVSRCFGASKTEDFCASAAAFFETKPLIFLQTVREKAIQDRWLKCLLTELPLDLVDRETSEVISVIDNRIAILNSIDDPSVIEVKERGLHFLKEERAPLERIMRDSRSQPKE